MKNCAESQKVYFVSHKLFFNYSSLEQKSKQRIIFIAFTRTSMSIKFAVSCKRFKSLEETSKVNEADKDGKLSNSAN